MIRVQIDKIILLNFLPLLDLPDRKLLKPADMDLI